LDCVNVQNSKLCIDCLFDSSCKRGYICNSDYQCVECPNCNCIDDSDCGVCENCESGVLMCIYTGTSKDCSECVNDWHCNEGYKCESYQCVAE